MSYACIELLPESKKYLRIVFEREDVFSELEKIFKINVKGWQYKGDHVTINMGEIYDPSLLGKYKQIKINKIGCSSKACALFLDKNSIAAKLSKNENPHITLYVNEENGGKSKDSNLIKKFHPWEFMFSGKIIQK